jgi:fructose-specific phosphotransferase system IIA component
MNLEKYINERCTIFDLKSNNKEDAIRELADHMNKCGLVKNSSRYAKSVFKREREYTTGVGNGIAIPHGKCRSVQKPSIAFGKSGEGIAWDSLDGNPVHYIFLLAIPIDSNNDHLEMLSSLARKLMKDKVIESIAAADNYKSLIEAFEDKEEEN